MKNKVVLLLYRKPYSNKGDETAPLKIAKYHISYAGYEKWISELTDDSEMKILPQNG